MVGLSGFLHDPKLVVARIMISGSSLLRRRRVGPPFECGGRTDLTVSDTSISGADANHFTVTATPPISCR